MSLKKSKEKLSAPLKDTNSRRFPSPTKPDQLEKAAEGVIRYMNTRNSTNWAVRTFLTWAERRNKREDGEKIPSDVLSCQDPGIVSFVMRAFVLEVRRADGEKYLPATIRNMFSGIYREMQKNKVPFSILDKGDHRFRDLHLTLDSVSSDLHRQGIGIGRKHAAVISAEDEDRFWETGALGKSSPTVLQNTVFFYVGMQFVLRGVQEQHNLLTQQFTRHPRDGSVYSTDVYYQYTEYISKNNQHRFKDSKAKNKEVRLYAQPESDRCLVHLLDTYLALLPVGVKFFYLHPCKEFPSDPTKPAYTRQRIGINKLKDILSVISSTSGVTTRYTNHCLRATAMTRMFNQGVPEKIIADKSGHRSVESLRAYEHPSVALEKAAGEVIADPKKQFLPDVKPVVKQEDSTSVMQTPPGLPGLSGNMANCTINVNISYGSK